MIMMFEGAKRVRALSVKQNAGEPFLPLLFSYQRRIGRARRL